jgi:hypothetical protein
MFFSFRVVAFAMMFGGGAMGLGSSFVMFSCLIVLISSHWIPPVNVAWSNSNLVTLRWFR